jgi:hypothetical protein
MGRLTSRGVPDHEKNEDSQHRDEEGERDQNDLDHTSQKHGSEMKFLFLKRRISSQIPTHRKATETTKTTIVQVASPTV